MAMLPSAKNNHARRKLSRTTHDSQFTGRAKREKCIYKKSLARSTSIRPQSTFPALFPDSRPLSFSLSLSLLHLRKYYTQTMYPYIPHSSRRPSSASLSFFLSSGHETHTHPLHGILVSGFFGRDPDPVSYCKALLKRRKSVCTYHGPSGKARARKCLS